MTPKITIKTGGVGMVLQAMGKARKTDSINIALGLHKCAMMVYDESQKLVPVKTGVLKASGRIEDGKGVGMAASSSVVYEAPYAVFVHENREATHKAPTSALFLSRAVLRTRGRMVSLLARQLKAGLIK